MIETILLYMTIAGGALICLSIIMLVFGFGDAEMSDMDLSTDSPDVNSEVGDSDGGLKLFSLHGIAGFCFITGISGLAFISYGVGITGSIILAFILGFLTMYAIAMIFKASKKLDSNGTITIDRAIGCSGTVYLPMDTGHPIGVVQVNVDGCMKEYDSISYQGEALKVGDRIIVETVEGSTVKVIKCN
jgi:membrane protein implicated in regulation of membrane protease activity